MPTVDVCRPRWHGRSGDACQSGKMATLLNSLLFVIKISLLYIDCIVKWCSCVTCNCRVLLDIGLILALIFNHHFHGRLEFTPSPDSHRFFYIYCGQVWTRHTIDIGYTLAGLYG